VHQTFALPVKSFITSLSKQSPVRAVLKAAEVIIIDEMSMLTSGTLNLVLNRLMQVHGCRDFESTLAKVSSLLVRVAWDSWLRVRWGTG